MTSEWANSHPNDVFSIFEKLARKASFTWNDVSPHVCDFDNLVDSKAIENFKELLENEVVKGCKEKGDIAALKLVALDKLSQDFKEVSASKGTKTATFGADGGNTDRANGVVDSEPKPNTNDDKSKKPEVVKVETSKRPVKGTKDSGKPKQPPVSWSCRVGVCVGAPGAGKSTIIKGLLSKVSRSAVVLPNLKLLKAAYSGNPQAFLIDDMYTKPVDFARYEVLLVDEFTKVHMCEVMVLAAILRVKNVILFGDPHQGMNYKPGSFVYYNFPVLAESHTSHRMPSAIGDAYNKAMGTKVAPKSKALGEFSVRELLGEIRDRSKILCISKGTKDFLAECDIEADIVTDIQGAEYDVVTLVLKEEYDVKPFCDKSIRCVALSRAKEVLIIQADPVFKSMIENAEFSAPGSVDSSCSGETLCNSR